jgi:hypothetical protein
MPHAEMAHWLLVVQPHAEPPTHTGPGEQPLAPQLLHNPPLLPHAASPVPTRQRPPEQQPPLHSVRFDVPQELVQRSVPVSHAWPGVPAPGLDAVQSLARLQPQLQGPFGLPVMQACPCDEPVQLAQVPE